MCKPQFSARVFVDQEQVVYCERRASDLGQRIGGKKINGCGGCWMIPTGSMGLVYLFTFAIKINQMQVHIHTIHASYGYI